MPQRQLRVSCVVRLIAVLRWIPIPWTIDFISLCPHTIDIHWHHMSPFQTFHCAPLTGTCPHYILGSDYICNEVHTPSANHVRYGITQIQRACENNSECYMLCVWWRREVVHIFILLAVCETNPRHPSHKNTVMRSFDVSFSVILTKLLNKQPNYLWSETPWR